MDYFRKLQQLLQVEKEEDRRLYEELTKTLSVQERRANGMAWYPVAIKDTELDRADYLTVEVERTSHQDVIHQFRFGMSAALFSQHDPQSDRVAGTITYISGDRLKIALRTEELPDWSRNGKLGIDVIFDENSYTEMETALKQATLLSEDKTSGRLIQVLTGARHPDFHKPENHTFHHQLNEKQKEAVQKIVAANDLAVVHGPPGTGKTTTLVQAIKTTVEIDRQQVLVVAPSNAAVDLLSEKLAAIGLNVVRVGNPAKVSEQQLALTLDSRMATHSSMKVIRQLRKQAAEFRDMAQKYKRNFGPAEREQRKSLKAEARNISKEVERTERYIIDDVLTKANVITATLVGANHYTVRHLRYKTVFIDEAGQALEPACWIPILKAQKLVMAGDHCQLPPTIKSKEAAKAGLEKTLMEKCVALYPEAVILLEEQYRMHEDIMTYPSQVFYQNKLRAHAAAVSRNLWHKEPALQFIDTAGCGFEEKWEGTSLSNPEEAAFLLKQIAALAAAIKKNLEPPAFPTIAIISPYKHQVEILKEQWPHYEGLNELAGCIAVNTIDSFQGQERDIVFISMTRSNTENSIGFLSDIRRMNVAMTRARKKLVMIGDSATLSQLPYYANLISYTQEKGAYQSAWELMGWEE